MTDWDLMTPGIGLTTIGIAGVGMSLSGIAKTFIDGMHAVSLLTMFIGMIFLASGLFKDGFPAPLPQEALAALAPRGQTHRT